MKVVRGTRVVVPEGCEIVSDMTPGVGRRTAGRTHVVKVDHVSSRERRGVHQPTVRWAGSGGYWREAFLKDVEVLNEEV